MPPSKARRAASVPERSTDQRMDALKRANDIRTARARLKRNLRRGRASVVQILADPPEYVLTAKVFDLITASPKYGRAKTSRLFNQARISPSKTVGGLSERQRTALISTLGQARESSGLRAPKKREVKTKKTPPDPAKFLLAEWNRLIGDQEIDQAALERAARIVAAEESWRSGLGALLSEDDVTRLLEATRRQLGSLKREGKVITLPASDDTDRYPAYQFQDGKPTPPLARAHRVLVESGDVSPWTAASWARTSHPELEELSPAQWSGEKRSEETLMRVAEHDASRLAQ